MDAFKVDAVDTLGAGDTFHGGFAVHFVETRDVVASMRFAAAAAAIKCMRFGGLMGAATRAEVEAFLKERAWALYFFDGQGAPHGAQAPAKSSGDTARPLDGLVR